MTTRTWNGSNDSFSNAAAWSPTGVPVAGDIATINAGTVLVTGTVSGVAVKLTETSGSTASTTMTLSSATLDASSTLSVNNQNIFNGTAPTLAVNGTSVIAGTASFSAGLTQGAQAQITISAGSTLVNRGTIDFYSTSPTFSGGGTLENDATIALVNPNNAASIPLFNDAVTGSGTIALGTHARIAFGSSVAAGQTLLLNDGATGNETVELDQPGSFSGTINGFSSSDLIAVVNTPYTNATYTSTGANSGVLSLFNGATLEGSINFAGQYSLSSFGFVFNNFGGGLSNLQITTTVVNAQSGGLPPGYQDGGNGSLPVYRFFDTIYGTHLFTQGLGEAQQILATRPDLTEETNNFGAVSQSSPNSEPVYRFFETSNGTHFFTASQAEFTALTTQGSSDYRPDLTYEASSTFYEDATQQAGDVPVYRLFDTVHGTQFLTGSQSEYNGLTTAGSGTYRADLTPEGVAFYAPTGSYTA